MRAGEVYENRVQGDRFVVREGSADTGGARLLGDLYVRPGGRVAGKHTHAYITERFEVLSDRPVRRPDVAEAALGEPLAHQLVERERRVAQQGAEIVCAGPLAAGARARREGGHLTDAANS